VPENIGAFDAIPMGLKRVATMIKTKTKLDPQLIFCVVAVCPSSRNELMSRGETWPSTRI
jgi:hypothetical protein